MKRELVELLAAQDGLGVDHGAARRQLVRALARRFDAGCGLAFSFVDVDGVSCLADPFVVGPQEVQQQITTWQGTELRAAFGDAQLGADSNDVTDVGSFSVLDAESIGLVPALAWLRKHDVHSALRIHVACHGESAGWLGLFRTGGQPPFSGRDLRAARQIQADVARVVCSFARASDLEQLSGDVVVVTNARGDVVNYTNGAARWLARTRVVSGLAENARVFLSRGDERCSWLFERTSLRFDRLDANGEHVVITARPVPFAKLSPLADLTPAQRRVAVMGAEGASVNEIARELSRSRETVREHLAAVYRRLGVRCRVDLARRLGNVGQQVTGGALAVQH